MGAAAIAVLSLILVMVEQNAKKKKGEPVTI
jgi:hypothetical protein